MTSPVPAPRTTPPDRVAGGAYYEAYLALHLADGGTLADAMSPDEFADDQLEQSMNDLGD